MYIIVSFTNTDSLVSRFLQRAIVRPQFGGLKQYKFCYYLTAMNSQSPDESHRPKLDLEELHSLLEPLEENLFSCLFQL